MDIVAKRVGDVTVIQIASETLTSTNIGKFKIGMEGYLKTAIRMVLDMGQLRFVDSSGIGAILACSKALAAAGGSLRLCSLTEPVRNLFELVHLHRILKIYPTREEAVYSFGHEPKRE
jgi:anti-sigma B factor antagonist